MNNLKKYAGLLNEAAPKGEFLAYINEDESKMLKDAGASGLLTPQGIPSYRGIGGYQSGQSASTSSSSSSSSSSSPSPGDTGGEGGNNPQDNSTSQFSGGGGDNNNNNSVPKSSYDTAGIVSGDIDAEDEYLAPDIDHYKATQKAINKLNKTDINQSDYNDWTKEAQDTYQLEMNKLKGTEDVNYSFYKGNEGTTNLTFGEHWKDSVITDPALKFSPTLRFLVAAGRTLKENATTDYGTGYYGGYTADGMGSGQPVDGGGWLGRIFNSDGTVNTNITESEAEGLYKQAQNDLPFFIGNTQPQESMVNKYFANMGSNLGVSSAYMDTYNAAKNKISQTLNLTPNTQQYGYGNTFNDNYARSMTSANPFFDELTNQGLI